MKKLLLLSLIVLLSACSSVTPEPTPTLAPGNTATPLSATSAPNPATTPKPTASAELEAYVNEVFLILDDLSQTSEKMDQLFTLASRRNSDMTDEGWLKIVDKTFEDLLAGADKIDAIKPVPVQAEDAHKYFKLAAEELRLVVDSQRDFIDGDIDGAYSATEHMQLHLSYVQKALVEVNKFEP